MDQRPRLYEPLAECMPPSYQSSPCGEARADWLRPASTENHGCLECEEHCALTNGGASPFQVGCPANLSLLLGRPPVTRHATRCQNFPLGSPEIISAFLPIAGRLVPLPAVMFHPAHAGLVTRRAQSLPISRLVVHSPPSQTWPLAQSNLVEREL